MSRKTPILIDVAIGIVLTTFIAWGHKNQSFLTETASLKTYDYFTKLSHSKNAPASKQNDIRLITIDDNAVSNLGRWPWPRSIQAQLIDELVTAGASVIGMNIVYSEADQNEGLEKIAQLKTSFAEMLEKEKSVFKKKNIKTQNFDAFLASLTDMETELNSDAILARSIEESSAVVLPMFFEPGDPLGNNLTPLPEYFLKNKLATPAPAFKILSGVEATLPIEKFGQSAVAVGHSNLVPDLDGTIRRIAPVMKYGDALFPSFGVELIREYWNFPKESMSVDKEKGLLIKSNPVPMDHEGKTFIQFLGPAGTFKTFSALDVLSNGIPEDSLKKKIVLVGVTATGNADTYVVPGGERLTGLEIWANHIENILSQRFVTRPPWAQQCEWLMILLAALILIGLLPFVPRAQVSIPITATVLLSFMGLSLFLFISKGFWVSPAYGSLLLGLGFAVWLGRRLMFTEKGKEIMEAEGVETNKMLGLSFQGQGMLDLAFEKFRKCPVDQSLKELLYNLALDMERKRQFAKAAAVYEHISTVDAGYKDIKDKIEFLKKAGEGAMFGSIGKKGTDATVVVDGMSQHTTLGRYEVMKEIGRGAMGVVYLGKDPKINRSVAIKTLRFEDNVDEDQVKTIKERFFKEAESAGSLTHPNIIRIFDAGEDQEVAYIAMELLEGTDLKPYVEKNHLFPVERTLDIITQIADALDYAHKQGVVHRDIKPGNIMLLKDDSLRITDFGIARIQATSKTATGAVLGTPAYMSPEQVNGKKVDGRADIFSLGVTLYELLTGEKPFQAESIAALLYRIANIEHPDPREVVPSLPEGIIPILKKSLAKNVEERYQTAGEMAKDLRVLTNALKLGTSSLSHGNDSQEADHTPTNKDFLSELEQEFKVDKPH